MIGKTRWWIRALGATSAIAALGCSPSPEVIPDPTPATPGLGVLATQPLLAGRPECPHDWDLKREQVPDVASTINIPEFNDCQRFIVRDRDGTLHYDSLYAIFAADTLMVLDSIDPGTRIAVAEIYSEGRYDTLGIARNLNCLIIARDSSPAPGTWEARMIPVTSGTQCDTLPDNTGTLLTVHRLLGHFSSEDFPRVARWQWDSANMVQYIGVYCGRAWCAVTNPELTPVFPPATGNRTRAIPGWHDDQLLAYHDANGYLRPSLIHGTIYPDPGLDARTSTAQFAGWTPAAQVTLEPLTGVDPRAIGQYKQTMNFDVTLPGQFNLMLLCYGDIRTTPNPCPMSPADSLRLANTCGGSGLWWAMVVAAGGDRKPLCVMRRPNENVPFRIPGTARWRWVANDERTWKACVQGCCETGPS